MKINLTIESEDQSEITKLFAALAAAGGITGITVGTKPVIPNATPAVKPEVKETLEIVKGETEETTAPDEKPEADVPAKKPSDLKKEAINAEIVALGGTPVEKGSLAKHEAALADIKPQTADEAADAEEVEHAADKAAEEKPEADIDTEDVPGDETGTEEKEEGVSLDDMRTFGAALIKSTPGDSLGKKALAECVAKVGVKNLTEASEIPGKLDELLPLLEDALGMTLAEVLAKA